MIAAPGFARTALLQRQGGDGPFRTGQAVAADGVPPRVAWWAGRRVHGWLGARPSTEVAR